MNASVINPRLKDYRIVVVFGIRTRGYHSAIWRKTLDGYDAHFFDNPSYFWWQQQRVRTVFNQVKEELEIKKPTILIGHSFGGLISQSALLALDDARHIKAHSTMASPHGYERLGFASIKEILGYQRELVVPTKTYGGYFDAMVPFNKTRLANAIHENMPVEHLAFLFSKTIQKKVLNDAYGLATQARP